MNRLNRKVEYALIALKYMSEKMPGELTTAKEVVDCTGVPFDATARVMQVMGQKKLLRSEQGAHGGYLIVRDLSKVSFYDLVEMILGPMGIAKCLHGDKDCCDIINTCNIKSPISYLNRKLVDFYQRLSLRELLTSQEEFCGYKTHTSAEAVMRPQ